MSKEVEGTAVYLGVFNLRKLSMQSIGVKLSHLSYSEVVWLGESVANTSLERIEVNSEGLEWGIFIIDSKEAKVVSLGVTNVVA